MLGGHYAIWIGGWKNFRIGASGMCNEKSIRENSRLMRGSFDLTFAGCPK